MNTHNTDWQGLYGESWTGIITSESFAHPAKFSRGLIRHIYQHLLDEGWLQSGDTVLDPFGGVALGAWPALRMGLTWVGVELEEKFVALGQQNIDLWNARFGPHLPNWGSAVLLQGDSRRLIEVVGEAGAVIGSPPYAGSVVGSSEYETRMERLCREPIESLAPRWQREVRKYLRTKSRTSHCQLTDGGYGTSEGQLAAMPPGPEPGQVADGLVSSPPYEGSLDTPSNPGSEMDRLQRKLREGALTGRESIRVAKLGKFNPNTHIARNRQYGNSDGQLGQESGTTFWSAARVILQQCYHVLKPGAIAVWVVKRFVRDKQIVPFSQQWANLCQSCGFELLHWHRAMLVEDGGTQLGLMGEDKRKIKKQYSFFRRLHAQKYPHLEIQWEDILCMRKV